MNKKLKDVGLSLTYAWFVRNKTTYFSIDLQNILGLKLGGGGMIFGIGGWFENWGMI